MPSWRVSRALIVYTPVNVLAKCFACSTATGHVHKSSKCRMCHIKNVTNAHMSQMPQNGGKAGPWRKQSATA
eukprot:1161654-Pelagomonas_calceolata.AAC.8